MEKEFESGKPNFDDVTLEIFAALSEKDVEIFFGPKELTRSEMIFKGRVLAMRNRFKRSQGNLTTPFNLFILALTLSLIIVNEVLVEEVIHVPSAKPFSKMVSECKNSFKASNYAFPLIDMDRVVKEAVCLVKCEVGKETSENYRVPPLVLSKLARGGKTTTLAQIFGKLKQTTDLKVIGISFNGQNVGSFQYRTGETQSQAISRLIAAQLTDCTDAEKQRLIVDRTELDKYTSTLVTM